MRSDTATILCGSCKVPVEGPADPNPQDTITCPRCGRHDSFQNVMASVTQHATDLMGNNLHDSFARSMRGNKFVKVTSKRIPQRSYPFISNLKL
jgi:hypothetical protein